MSQPEAEQQPEQPKPLPQPSHRYDGVLKVTGTAKYAAEFREPVPRKDLVYAFIVQSTIPSGSVKAINTHTAERASGIHISFRTGQRLGFYRVISRGRCQ
jgi:xanthine dehydrogenase YagR molybdenum-binding subunit